MFWLDECRRLISTYILCMEGADKYYACMHACMHAYIYIYIYTYTYIYIYIFNWCNRAYIYVNKPSRAWETDANGHVWRKSAGFMAFMECPNPQGAHGGPGSLIHGWQDYLESKSYKLFRRLRKSGKLHPGLRRGWVRFRWNLWNLNHWIGLW